MRVKNLAPDQMNADQRRVYDDIVAGPRGRAEGPHKVWLHSPELADSGQRLGAFCRYGSSLPARLSELAIIVTGRFYTAHYEWYAHASLAKKAGIDDAIVDAIRDQRTPTFQAADEQIVYEIAHTLHREHRLSDELYARGVEILGTQGMVDLVGVLGYYALVSLTLNAFEVELPEGVEREF